MGEVIRFLPKSEPERVRLIREARAIYDSVFPPAGPPESHAISDANTHRNDGVKLS